MTLSHGCTLGQGASGEPTESLFCAQFGSVLPQPGLLHRSLHTNPLNMVEELESSQELEPGQIPTGMSAEARFSLRPQGTINATLCAA